VTFTAPLPFAEAIAIAQRKGILPTNLTSAQLSRLEAELKRRAWFSATLDKAQVLQVLADNVEKIVGRVGIPDENGRLRSIPEAKSQLREALAAAGVPGAQPGQRNIQDFYSDARRQLMIETNVLDTLGAGQHIAGNDPVALEVNPAYELIRMIVPKGGVAAERDWIERWHDAMDAIGSDAESGCTDPDDAGGRMVALKNHPIWDALGDGAGGYADCLGNSWPPYAFNSGMNRIVVPRADCIELGILDEDEQVQPDDSIDLNENLQASAGKFGTALQAQLARQAGLELTDGVLRLVQNRALRNSNDNHDARGRFTTRGAAAESLRGLRAVKTALREKRDAISAMSDPELGPIDFVFKGRGGKGLAGIIRDHGVDAAHEAPMVIAFGTKLPRNGNTQVIVKDGWRVVLTKSDGLDKRHWVLTSYDTGKKKERLVNAREDLIPSRLRSAGLHWPRPVEGAVARRQATLRAALGQLREAA
jgi:hypothetical protein